MESITLKIPKLIINGENKNLIVLTVYRQPGHENLREFLKLLEKWLEKYDKGSNEIIITGDLNLDLLKFESHGFTSEYLDLLSSHGLLPVITKPTRIKHRSATLFDHIFSKMTNLISGVMLSELSGQHGFTDHYPTFCIVDIGKRDQPSKENITRRYFTKEGHKGRKDDLRQESWEDFYHKTNPDSAYELFQEKYSKCFEKNLTTKTFQTGHKMTPRQPWMTFQILKKMKKRDQLARNTSRRNDYKLLRNEIVKDCRRAERNYLNEKIMTNMNNVKEHWKILNNVMGKMNNKCDFPAAFKSENNWFKNPKVNAENFNTYYSNVGPSTNSSVGNSEKNASHYLSQFKDRNPHEIETHQFSKEDVIDACQSISKKKTCDPYDFSQQAVLNAIHIIAPMLAHIANCSMTEGKCPDLSKVAKVIPVYKGKGEKYLYSNYRPISLLPVFSKIIEKLVYNKIFHFLVRYNILFKSQFGFRRGHSTAHATLDFLQTIESAFLENEYAVGVFCDLSKAFDTLDHNILLSKLDHYGIRGTWLSWLKSYLSNRRQFVDLGGVRSDFKDIIVGVPQGSILGPLLFLIYINDLPASLSKLIPVMFADDTNLVIKGNNLIDLVTVLNRELKSLGDFFKANKLKLNTGKTKLVCFRKKP